MNLKKLHILSLVFLLFAGTVCAQPPVVISGTAPFAAGEEIRLMVYDDLLNDIPSLAATDIIDKHGRFTIKYKTADIKAAQLAIRTSKADIFIVPSVSYDFAISVDSLLFRTVNPERYGGMLNIRNLNPDTADLNVKINRFSRFYGALCDNFSFGLLYGGDPGVYDTIRQNVTSRFPYMYAPENYYLSYIYYTLGGIDLLQHKKKNSLVYGKYFDNDNILYNNPAYMALFNQYYSGYLYMSPKISKELLTTTINEKPDYLTLFNEAGRDPNLANARLRELVIIKNLIEFSENKEFDKENVLGLLDYIRKTTSFGIHAKIIDNTFADMERKRKPMAEVTFKDEKSRKVSLKHFEGKPVYLQIFQSDCVDCIREMAMLKELESKYGEKVQFVSLCIDPEESGFSSFVRKYKKNFGWPVLYFNQEYEWLYREGIETLPDHILFNPDGTVAMRYAPSPERGLPEFLLMNFSGEEQQDQNPLFFERNKQQK